MVLRSVSLIVACTNSGGIAYNNEIPWHIPSDLEKFKKVTTMSLFPEKKNAVIMGRNTWESIGKRLPDRLNIVVTSDYNYYIKDKRVIVAHSIMSALEYCNKPYVERIFIIGGTSLYNAFLVKEAYLKMVDRIYMSVMFYDKTHVVNKFIDIDSVYKNFELVKDAEYQKEAKHRLFASYICFPKKSQEHLAQKCFNVNRLPTNLCEL